VARVLIPDFGQGTTRDGEKIGMLTSPDLPNTPANLIISLRMGIKQLKVLPLAGNPPNGIRQKPYQRIAPSKE